MFDGFRPELQGLFFERRIVSSAVTLGVLLAGAAVYVTTLERAEKTIEVALADPDVSDFATEDEEEPEVEEVEPEAEAPPPPPPDAKVKRVKKPTPKPKPVTPTAKPTEAAQETGKDKVIEVPMDGPTSGTGMGGGSGKPGGAGVSTKPAKPSTAKPKPKAKPEKKSQAIDPTKPIDRPENATVPKPLPDNEPPAYPKKLRDEGISGRIVLKLHVHRDGTVRGAKVLSKKNSATTEDEQKAASAAFLKSVIKVVKSWRFKPATLAGKPISVWHKVTIPFELTD